MRAHTRITALLTCCGLGLVGCGESEQPAPEPAAAPVSVERRGQLDRAAAIQDMLALIERGELGPAFEYLADDVVWSEVGMPGGELSSAVDVIAYQRRFWTGFSDVHIKAKRIIEEGDHAVVELVWSARHSGSLADRTPATGRVVTMPSAMLLRYQADGLIDRAWVFQDALNLEQQLGLAPGLSVDFEPVAMPARTEIVSGMYDSAIRPKYLSFLMRFRPDEYHLALAEDGADDVAWLDQGSGQVATGVGAITALLGERMTSFAPLWTELGTSIGAKGFFAAFVTTELVYKGGFMGVPADGQQILTHSLDIVQFDPTSMRFKALASYGNAYEIAAALQDCSPMISCAGVAR